MTPPKAAPLAQIGRWFRDAAPYIHAHRGRMFVVYLGSNALGGPYADRLVEDVAILSTLGIRLVLVYGTRAFIDERLFALGRPRTIVSGLRVTDEETMSLACEVAGRLRFQIEARLSMALRRARVSGESVHAVSGNFVQARPVGVHEGVDLQLTGVVRRVDTSALARCLSEGAVLLLPPVGYSASGEIFNLEGSELAARIAIELAAAKLLLVDRGWRIEGTTVRELTVQTARDLLAERRHRAGGLTGAERALERLTNACHLGVRRGHLLDGDADGALILELFTRDGLGTMVAADVYDEIRGATPEDLPGIAALLAPLEESGALARRPRDRLERELERFVVMERDGMIIGCAAALPYPPSAGRALVELACFAVHESYRNRERGDALLRRTEQEAKRLGGTHAFVLTTQAQHWFRERGFVPRDVGVLPSERRSTLDLQRNSSVLVKALV